MTRCYIYSQLLEIYCKLASKKEELEIELTSRTLINVPTVVVTVDKVDHFKEKLFRKLDSESFIQMRNSRSLNLFMSLLHTIFSHGHYNLTCKDELYKFFGRTFKNIPVFTTDAFDLNTTSLVILQIITESLIIWLISAFLFLGLSLIFYRKPLILFFQFFKISFVWTILPYIKLGLNLISKFKTSSKTTQKIWILAIFWFLYNFTKYISDFIKSKYVYRLYKRISEISKIKYKDKKDLFDFYPDFEFYTYQIQTHVKKVIV